MALDGSGQTLKKALEEVGLQSPKDEGSLASRLSNLAMDGSRDERSNGTGLRIARIDQLSTSPGTSEEASASTSSAGDYFSR